MITIIIPAYQASKFLEDCIRSMVFQNIKKEILIGIDGCPDTLNFTISNELIKNNCKIYYFENNIGTYMVLNSLIKRSVYENVLFFGADDLMFDGLINEASEKLLDFDIVRWKYYNFKEKIENQVDSKEHSPGAFASRKNLLLKLNAFFPWRISADWEFQLRAKYNGATTFLSSNYFFRRIHENNLTVRKDTNFNSEARQVYIDYIKKSTDQKRFDNPENLFHIENTLISEPSEQI